MMNINVAKKSLPNIEKSAFFAIKVPPNPLNHMQIYRVYMQIYPTC